MTKTDSSASVSCRDEENQLQGVPVPSGNHPAGDLALRPVYPDLSRRRRFVEGTRYHAVLRNCSALGEPLRTDDRGAPAQTPTQTLYDLASLRSLSENP